MELSWQIGLRGDWITDLGDVFLSLALGGIVEDRLMRYDGARR